MSPLVIPICATCRRQDPRPHDVEVAKSDVLKCVEAYSPQGLDDSVRDELCLLLDHLIAEVGVGYEQGT